MAPFTNEELLGHAAFLRRLARSLLADEASADDVVQQTWLRAIEHPPRERASLRAWLSTVARNAASKFAAREREQPSREERGARPERVPSTDEVVARLSEQRAVVQAVLDLAEPYRTAVLLRFFEDLPPREIARRLDVPVETVKSRIKRALDELRSRLDREHGGDRPAWCLNLLPLAGWKLVAPPAGSSVLAGVIAMSLKMKIVLIAVLLLIAAIGYRFASHDRQAGVVSAPESHRAVGLGSSIPAPPGSEAPTRVEPSSNTVAAATPDPSRSSPPVPTHSAGSEQHGGASLTVIPRSPTGEPVEGCTVLLDRMVRMGDGDRATLENGGQVGKRASGADGKAEFFGLPVGTYAASAKGPGWSGREKEAVIRDPKERAVLDLPVEATASIKGTCKDAADRPFSGVPLNIETRSKDRKRSGFSFEPGLTSWDRAGNFLMTGIPVSDDNDYFLLVGSMDRPKQQVTIPVTLTPGSITDVGMICFRSADGSVAGALVDAEGKPIAGATIALFSGADRPEDDWNRTYRDPPQQTTDAQGRFRFPGIEKGAYSLRVRSFCLASPSVSTVEIASDGQEIDLGSLVVVQGTHVLRGEVVDASGNSLCGAWVSFGPSDTHTDEAGRFEIRTCSPGPYALRASISLRNETHAGLSGSVGNVRAEGQPVRVEVRLKGLNLLLTDAQTGAPVRGSWVTVALVTPGRVNMGWITYDETDVGSVIRVNSLDSRQRLVGPMKIMLFTLGYEPAEVDVTIPEDVDDREYPITVALRRLP